MSFWFIGAAVVTVVAGTFKAKGEIDEGKAQGKMYEYEESLAQQKQEQVRQQETEQTDLVKRTSERNITVTQGAAAEESKRLQRYAQIIYGKQHATMGASGISGVTAADIIKDTFEKSQLDQSAIKYNADVASWQYRENAKVQVWSLQEEAKNRVWALGEEAKQYSVAAKYARKTGRQKAIGTGLTTAASVLAMGALSGAGAGTTATTGSAGGLGKTGSAVLV